MDGVGAMPWRNTSQAAFDTQFRFRRWLKTGGAMHLPRGISGDRWFEIIIRAWSFARRRFLILDPHLQAAHPMSDKIREYIEQRFLIEFDESFPEDTDLFKAGVMDSFGYVQLCRFLEKEFSFRFSEEEMTGNVLTSLARIREYVFLKTSPGQAGAGDGVQGG